MFACGATPDTCAKLKFPAGLPGLVVGTPWPMPLPGEGPVYGTFSTMLPAAVLAVWLPWPA